MQLKVNKYLRMCIFKIHRRIHQRTWTLVFSLLFH